MYPVDIYDGFLLSTEEIEKPARNKLVKARGIVLIANITPFT